MAILLVAYGEIVERGTESKVLGVRGAVFERSGSIVQRFYSLLMVHPSSLSPYSKKAPVLVECLYEYLLFDSSFIVFSFVLHTTLVRFPENVATLYSSSP